VAGDLINVGVIEVSRLCGIGLMMCKCAWHITSGILPYCLDYEVFKHWHPRSKTDGIYIYSSWLRSSVKEGNSTGQGGDLCAPSVCHDDAGFYCYHPYNRYKFSCQRISSWLFTLYLQVKLEYGEIHM
jgi:hypothetical protein